MGLTLSKAGSANASLLGHKARVRTCWNRNFPKLDVPPFSRAGILESRARDAERTLDNDQDR